MRRGLLLLGMSAWLLPGISGCQNKKPAVGASESIVVPVSRPIQREVTDYVDFTGRISAVQSVDIRPRVTGYLTKMPFKEGADVKTGDLLFEIDPRPYQSQVDSYQSQVNLYQAQLRLARTLLARDQSINARVPNSISQQQLDQDHAAVEEAEARVQSFEKSLEIYKLNVEFTKVLAPIDGQVSRYYLTLGNLVNQDTTLLTTIVSVDPVYAYFEMDEPTLLRIRRAGNEGRIKFSAGDTTMPVLMGLQGEEGFPQQGTVNFINNQVNPTTGSILVRGVFPNPRPGGGQRLLSPGMFVRIRLPIGGPHAARLVIDRAVSSDQGLKYVYVLDAENKVQYRRVTTGPLQEDGMRVIEQGLEADDWVVVGALQQVRPRMEVKSERVPMPTLGPAAGPGGDAEPGKSAPRTRETLPIPAPGEPSKPSPSPRASAAPATSPAESTAPAPTSPQR